jgi:hypothetical protein
MFSNSCWALKALLHYRVSQKKLIHLIFKWITKVSVFFDSPCTGCPKKKWHYRNYLPVLKPLLNARDYTPGNLMNLYLHLIKPFKTFSLCPNILTPESSKTITLKAWFHGRFFSAKCEIFRLFLLNCEQSSRNNLFEWSQFKRNRRNNSHFVKKKRSWNQALISGLLFYFKFQKQKFMHLWDQLSARAFKL